MYLFFIYKGTFFLLFILFYFRLHVSENDMFPIIPSSDMFYAGVLKCMFYMADFFINVVYPDLHKW